MGCAVGGPRPFPPADPDLVARNQASGDPHGGRFPLEQALEGLPAEGSLVAVLVTSAGDVHCELDPGHAPLTVANFVGLARGLRAWQNAAGEWVTEPYYEGIPFHRAEERQFVQGGRRDGQEEVGFWIQDEVSPGDDFERGGVLAMANSGPNTGSAQFFITTGDVSHLEGLHTIFGECDDDAVVRNLEKQVLAGEKPVLQTVRVERI
jgi:peptidyl-prolyl cis-trans isomerase A (cyclophilin A)